MSNDITLPGTGAVVDTHEQADGSHRQVVAVGELASQLELLLQAVRNLPFALDPASGRMRVVLDANGGNQTLTTVTTVGTVSTITAGTITTVGTVTNVGQVGGIQANTLIQDAMASSWANCLRGRIT